MKARPANIAAGLFFALALFSLLCPDGLRAEGRDAERETKRAALIVHLPENEELLFGFFTKKGKMLTVSKEKKDAYIVYRFGTRDKVELEFPTDKASSYDEFTYSYYMRPGGPENAGLDLNYLRFENKGFSYEVYDEYGSESPEGKRESVGIRLKDLKSGKEYDIKGDPATMFGGLMHLRFMDKVRQAE